MVIHSHEPSAFSDQQSIDAMVDFLEAVKRSGRLKKRERIERRLEVSLRKAFKEQGRIFVRGMAKFRNRFTEAAQIQSPFGSDEAFLDESVPPTEWVFVFYEAAKKTFALFEKPIDAAVTVALAQGAASLISDLSLGVSFQLENPRAVKYLKDYGAARVTKINETTRDYLNTLLVQSANEGWSYDKTAQAIIDRYQEFAIGKPQQHIDSRAHLVAVTETGNANLEGQLIMAQDLQDAGIVVEKSWSTVGDDRVTEGCQTNEAAGWIPLEQTFPSGHMRPLRFPGCRCDLQTRVKH